MKLLKIVEVRCLVAFTAVHSGLLGRVDTQNHQRLIFLLQLLDKELVALHFPEVDILLEVLYAAPFYPRLAR